MKRPVKKTCSMLTVLLTGCAILPSRGPIEPTAPPAPVQTDQMAPSDQAPEPTSVRRVQSLLHSAFAAMDRADRLSALDSLAVASEVLIASYAPSGQNTTGQEPLERAVADDLTRAAIDIYYDALSGPEPLTSKSSAAQLIRALPSQFHSALSINDRIRLSALSRPVKIASPMRK